MFHVWQLTGLLSNLGILQQLLLSLLVKLWVEKVPLLQSLLLAGLNSLKKFQSEIHIFLNRISKWNKFNKAPCVCLMWSAEVDQYVAEELCIQKLSGPVIPSVWMGAMLVVWRKSSSILASIWEPQQCWHWHWGEEKWNQNPKFLNTAHTSSQSELSVYCDQKQHILYAEGSRVAEWKEKLVSRQRTCI